jgi:hypothetical protein
MYINQIWFYIFNFDIFMKVIEQVNNLDILYVVLDQMPFFILDSLFCIDIFHHDIIYMDRIFYSMGLIHGLVIKILLKYITISLIMWAFMIFLFHPLILLFLGGLGYRLNLL